MIHPALPYMPRRKSYNLCLTARRRMYTMLRVGGYPWRGPETPASLRRQTTSSLPAAVPCGPKAKQAENSPS
eukprot:scaffold408478_cov37-Prasinocladus_malaysianus.AAC.1